MRKSFFAAIAGIFLTAVASHAQDDITKNMINSPSADSWNAWGATAKVIEDATVQGGKATRFTITKGTNPWDASASDAIVKPVKKGDVILVAYWARAEQPPAGSNTISLPAVSIGLNKAPYTTFVSEAATINKKWGMYYASGVADDDYKPNQINVGIQLASDTQVIDLGPVFVIDFGPDYDRTKLPHNKIVAAPAPAAAAQAAPSAETRFTEALAKIRAKLPKKGTLISDPGQLPFLFGDAMTSQPLDAADVAAGKALRVTIAKAGAQPWDKGASLPLTGDIKKGDTILMAAYVRTHVPPAGSNSGTLTEIGVHMTTAPWTAIATASASVPKDEWKLVYASGVATQDYAASGANAGLQLGCCQQTLDLGPAFVLNLGQGVSPDTLPKN